MIDDNTLRLEVRQLKINKNISYKDIGLELGIKVKSFYGWIRGSYNLNDANKRKLELIISKYKGQ